MRDTGKTGSPLLMLGLLPALVCPIFFVQYVSKIGVFCDLRAGRNTLARWTVPADELKGFCDEDRRTPHRSLLSNFYLPPEAGS